MTFKRMLVYFLVALLGESAIFALKYRDLVHFRSGHDVVAADSPESFAAHATAALDRSSLPAGPLQRIADSAQSFGRADLEARALDRLVKERPDDVGLRLQLADALRRAGRLNQAERVYTSVLTPPHTADATEHSR